MYILRCKDGGHYTGYASNVKHRLNNTKKGQGAKYTRVVKPEKIVYVEEFRSRREAMRRERQIKSFSYEIKRKLITSYKKLRHPDKPNSEHKLLKKGQGFA